MTPNPTRLPRYSTAGGSLTRSGAEPTRALTSPATGVRRLELLDALRGFALFGVLMANLRSFSLFEFLTPADRSGLPTAAWDRAIEMAMELLVDARSITLFSLLFGVGFAMQMRRSTDTADGTRRYVRRMLILLAIGLVHAWLFWWGDILRYYAVFGLVLLAFTRLSPRMLAALGVFVAVAMPVLLQPVLPGLLPTQISPAQSAAGALTAFGSDQWSTMLDGNLTRDMRMRIAVWWLPLFVFGRLLIGAAIGRAGVLQESIAHRRFWVRLLAASLAVSVVATVLLLLRDHGTTGMAAGWLRSDVGNVVTRLLRHLAPLAQGLFYMAAFVLLFQRAAWRHWLRKLAPTGRMALTNYLAQTLFGLGLFYGIGLGAGPRFGLVGVVACSVVIFGLQAAFSCWWLTRFRFGPAEWLWRSLVYGKPQSMRLPATT
ncbi:DUF418 domain-containing protein [Variovorax sp. PAMC26660]|uniref:DUF418 domain-containing protein n=1 Tax=Variovorax sp. PAMC26660 TaxID=2762322 RepID=UPI00164E5025|nr:DUF418 domain-containing protein [Variovorax sp. PAMC26660]QNK68513.1 DUF418 domain-containing protein [Variovorax sp. PAMC26660]